MAYDVLDTIFGGGSPPLSHRFGVIFLHYGLLPNPLDIRFQQVSGLTTSVETQSIREGGQNLYEHRMPKMIKSENLVLHRGYSIISPLSMSFSDAMSEFKFYTGRVLLTMFDPSGIPTTAWLFEKAYPVKWSYSDFDADSSKVLVETLELAYATRKKIGL